MSIKRTFSVVVVLLGLVASLNKTPAAAQSSTDRKTAASSTQTKTVQMRITGMTCAACAKGLEASFRNMAGVLKAEVDYKAGQAVVTFDTAKKTSESIAKFVGECGYKVKEIKVV